MKYVLLLLVVIGLVFLSGVRRGRAGAAGRPGSPGRDRREGPSPDDTKSAALMVVCTECGTHLPQAEALPGRGGQFCCGEHRARFEAREHHG